jgi:hypothetical protein
MKIDGVSPSHLQCNKTKCLGSIASGARYFSDPAVHATGPPVEVQSEQDERGEPSAVVSI